MSRTFTKKLTVDQLAQQIWDAWVKHDDYDAKDSSDQSMTAARIIGEGIPYQCLTQRIVNDLRKVSFDSENIADDAHDSNLVPVIGYHTLENDLTYAGILAGGDWETPVVFIIYSDGKKLRGYIPTKGNLWNRATKEAYGNDDIADAAQAKMLNCSSHEDLNYDVEKILDDLRARIKYTGV